MPSITASIPDVSRTPGRPPEQNSSELSTSLSLTIAGWKKNTDIGNFCALATASAFSVIGLNLNRSLQTLNKKRKNEWQS